MPCRELVFITASAVLYAALSRANTMETMDAKYGEEEDETMMEMARN